MLGDAAMAAPTKTYPELKFGEDMQTSRGFCWATNDTNYVYTGHQGIWKGEPVSKSPGWRPYEHTPPSLWYCCESGYTLPLGESYRRCCTSHTWIAEALSARLMGAMELWDHSDFFGYCDRWMTDTHFYSLAIIAIKEARGWDFSADWQRQGKSWDDITNNMWKAYRNVSTAKTFRNKLTSTLSGQTILYNMRGQVIGKTIISNLHLHMLGQYLSRTLQLPCGIYLCKSRGKSVWVIVRKPFSTTTMLKFN